MQVWSWDNVSPRALADAELYVERASDSSKYNNLCPPVKRAPVLILAKMRPPTLPVSSLRTWAKFNGIEFEEVSVEKNKEYGGFGVVSTTTIDSAPDQEGNLTVLNIPKDLILSAETIAEHAKIDKHFGEILEAVGGSVGVRLVDHV